MNGLGESGYISVSNEADRLTVASILFKNDYTVQKVRTKKNGTSYEYLIRYERLPKDISVEGEPNESKV